MTLSNRHKQLFPQPLPPDDAALHQAAMHTGSVNSSASTSADETWYLRIDGHVFGPATRNSLEQFLRPPRLCKSMEVLCSSRINDWHVIASEETLDHVLHLAGICPEADLKPDLPDEPIAPDSLFSRQMRQLCTTVSAWLKATSGIIAIAGILLVVNVAFLCATRDPQTREQEILALYESIWDQLQIYRSGDVMEEDWRSFADSVLTEIDPILVELGRTADVHHSMRQNLLFAGREQLRPVLLAEQPPASDSLFAKVFERYLLILKHDLGAESPIMSKRR